MAKKKTSSRGRKQSQWASDAALQALVRFGPEESGLAALAQQLRANYKTSVNQARATSAGIIQAVNDVRPEMTKTYDRAGLEQARAASVIAPDLANLGPVANAIRMAAHTEQAQGGRHIAEAKAAALGGLSERKVSAAQGAQFGIQNARQTFVSDMAKLLERKQGLGREKGAFTAATINALAEKEADRALTRRGQNLTAETSRRGQDITARGQDITARGQDLSHADRVAARREDAKTKRAGGKPQTPAQHGAFKDNVEAARQLIREYKPDYSSRHELAGDLLNGVPSIKDPKTGKSLPGVPKAPGGQLALSVALDLEFDRHLSRRNVGELHRRRISVGRLGYKGAAGTRRAAPRRPRRSTASTIPGLGSTLR